jgi:hypothetical protein
LIIENSIEQDDKGLYKAVFENNIGVSESKSNVTILSNYDNFK